MCMRPCPDVGTRHMTILGAVEKVRHTSVSPHASTSSHLDASTITSLRAKKRLKKHVWPWTRSMLHRAGEGRGRGANGISKHWSKVLTRMQTQERPSRKSRRPPLEERDDCMEQVFAPIARHDPSHPPLARHNIERVQGPICRHEASALATAAAARRAAATVTATPASAGSVRSQAPFLTHRVQGVYWLPLAAFL
jgi:hypothetical protein